MSEKQREGFVYRHNKLCYINICNGCVMSKFYKGQIKSKRMSKFLKIAISLFFIKWKMGCFKLQYKETR